MPGKQMRVGIWKLGGAPRLVRDEERIHEWSEWADLTEIPLEPEAQRRRILFFGESTARGYFYDPIFTPAQVLESILQHHGINCEVIDLAKTGLGLAQLIDLVRSSMVLNPDALVIFGGNNWYLRHNKTIQTEFADKLQKGEGIRSLKEIIELRLWEKVGRVPSIVKSICADHGFQDIPVTFLIPEFNLMDWSWLQGRRQAPLLGPGKNEAWQNLLREGDAALKEQSFDTLLKMAQKMLKIDGGTSPISYELQGRSLYGLGHIANARESLEMARDCALLDDAFFRPRTHSLIADVLRKETSRLGMSLVDLPRIFDKLFPHKLPGHELFHDYCHMTAKGIQIAMASTAKTIASKMHKQELELPVLIESAPQAPNLAQAHFLAAIHNAHWGQDKERVKYQLRRALKLSDGKIDSLLLYCDYQTRLAPNILCSSFLQLLDRDKYLQRYLGNMSLCTFLNKIPDLLIGQIIIEELAPKVPSLKTKIEDLWKNELTLVQGRHLNLIRPTYGQPSFLDSEIALREKRSYMTAGERVSEFVFLCSSPGTVNLRLCLRLPAWCTKGDSASMSLNGKVNASLKYTEKWQNLHLRLKAKAGTNQILIQWPPFKSSLKKQRKHILMQIKMGVKPTLYPIFGFISQLEVEMPTQRPLSDLRTSGGRVSRIEINSERNPF